MESQSHHTKDSKQLHNFHILICIYRTYNNKTATDQRTGNTFLMSEVIQQNYSTKLLERTIHKLVFKIILLAMIIVIDTTSSFLINHDP